MSFPKNNEYHLLRNPEPEDYSPIKVKIGGVEKELQSDKWYMLNIVRFKYCYSVTRTHTRETRYRFIIFNTRGNKNVVFYKKYQLEKFDSLLLDNRRDVIMNNRIYGENAEMIANGYSKELIDKKIEDIELKDYDKNVMLPRTGESEDSLNHNTIVNLG